METKLITNLNKVDNFLVTYIIPFGWKILGAFAVWIIGGLVIKAIQKVLDTALQRKQVDPTLVTYAHSTLGVALKILLVVAIMGVFGIETTSFSAILAAAGVAIGMAWSGLLANFAAGTFLILFRPFKVGDTIMAAGVTGVVREIGMFASSIDTDANIRIFVSNNKIFADNIVNYSMNPHRTAVFKVQLAHSVNPKEAIEHLKKRIVLLPGVETTLPVAGEITEFNAQGAVVTLKASANNKDYASVLGSGYQAIFETLQEAGYPIPETKVSLVSKV